jgi:hypothetical protein
MNFNKASMIFFDATGSILIGKMSACMVGDAYSSALFTCTGHTFDVVAIEIAVNVPANQTAVTKFPVTSGHGCHRHGHNEQNNRQDGRNLHPVSINQSKKF